MISRKVFLLIKFNKNIRFEKTIVKYETPKNFILQGVSAESLASLRGFEPPTYRLGVPYELW